ncbi:thymidylate synthase [Candidatus Tachikawaea gelatinosa]|uniref:Thymidylate synthase n=1 Tax=Candidatus Tachikawaea gelatinosa TaxID=1410383 RepID=A0A090ALD3_9ENTR|nr:thymidylate synthase [Candidatus Tachikawaea gelatinosa]BAP58439.1 thymidylate synthase [Candidatus Tachikawaea gelatinosa]
MKQYLELVKKVISKGTKKKDRTGIGTLSIFAHQMRFNLKKGFPLITTKKCYIPAIIHELLWFLKGETNVRYLQKKNITIWNEWADKLGNLGPIYGKQWRFWQTSDNGKSIDQISSMVHALKYNPNSRRMLVSAWNVGDIEKMALPPCHVLFQLYVNNKKLSCQIYQRSCDVFLGLPFNIASYALLLHMFAEQTNLKPHELIWTGGDIHLYINHLKQANTQLKREPKPLPNLIIQGKPKSIFDYSFDDFLIKNYTPHPSIKAEIAI